MAFTGVNRSNVAVTDTFDTWRIRTNEINTSLNAATAANTADTIMWRDDAGSANVNILNANTTVITHTGSSDTALSMPPIIPARANGSLPFVINNSFDETFRLTSSNVVSDSPFLPFRISI